MELFELEMGTSGPPAASCLPKSNYLHSG